jgi:flagellar basal body-associated protein FliL
MEMQMRHQIAIYAAIVVLAAAMGGAMYWMS